MHPNQNNIKVTILSINLELALFDRTINNF